MASWRGTGLTCFLITDTVLADRGRLIPEGGLGEALAFEK
jgi:hypothetical protein